LGRRSTTSHGLSYLGTLRARIGVLIVPSFLLYATGGLAYGGARSDTTIVQSIDDPPLSTLMTSGSFSKTRVGYAVGGEWMLSSNWSAKLEYLTDRQSPAVTQVCPARHIRHSSALRIEKTA
jgi:outer membrane immunogenic protein